MPLPETRHSLIVRLKDEHNDTAWSEFVASYEPFLYRMAARNGVPDRHVPDVVQQVLMAVARSLDAWQDDGNDGSFRRWLTTVARNIVIKFMTKERRQDVSLGGSEFLRLMEGIAEEPSEEQIQKYEYELIVWAAERVRSEFMETSWAAFWATTIEARAVNDVAIELGLSPGSIYMSRSRIMARIRGIVNEAIK